jgi:hypothetical protein
MINMFISRLEQNLLQSSLCPWKFRRAQLLMPLLAMGLFFSATEGKAQWNYPQRNIAGVGTSYRPSVAVFNGLLYAAWKGGGDDGGIYWSRFDGGAWAPQQRIVGVGTSHGPSLAVAFGKLFAAWKGNGNDGGIYWSTFDPAVQGWTPQRVIAGVGTSHGPSLSEINGALYAAWKGYGNDSGIYWCNFAPQGDFGRGEWLFQRHIDGVGTSHGPSLASFNGILFAAWKGGGDDGGIYWSTLSIDQEGIPRSWAPQQRIAGVGTSHGPSLAQVSSRLFAAWKAYGNDGGIWWSTFDGSNPQQPWAPQQHVEGVGTSVGPSITDFRGSLFGAWKGYGDDTGIYYEFPH